MKTFPEKHLVRICIIYDKWIKANSNLPSKTLYYVLILLDLMIKWQNNETSENNQSRINVFIDWAQGTDRKFLQLALCQYFPGLPNLTQSLSVCHEHCPFFSIFSIFFLMADCMLILGSKQVVTKAVSRNDSNIVYYLQCIEGIVALEYGLKI